MARAKKYNHEATATELYEYMLTDDRSRTVSSLAWATKRSEYEIRKALDILFAQKKVRETGRWRGAASFVALSAVQIEENELRAIERERCKQLVRYNFERAGFDDPEEIADDVFLGKAVRMNVDTFLELCSRLAGDVQD